MVEVINSLFAKNAFLLADFITRSKKNYIYNNSKKKTEYLHVEIDSGEKMRESAYKNKAEETKHNDTHTN